LLPLALVLAQFSYDWMPLQFALAFLLALGAQLIGRWLFYKRIDEREI
jgi:DMSO reductase anchor subunit